jgi:predicted RecA/RadA family phage recombinase
MKNYVQQADLIPVTAPRTLTSGAGALVGTLFGAATAAAASGASVVIQTTGVVDLPKATGAVTQGAAVYWDNTAFNVTTTATNNKLIGAAIAAAASGDALVRVRLNGVCIP